MPAPPPSPPQRSDPRCIQPDLSPAIAPLVGSLTWHQLSTYIGATCGILAIIISMGNMLYHAANCYKISEQKYLMRIHLVIPAFVLFYLISLYSYSSFQYISDIPDVVEGIAFAGLFQLFREQAAGSTDRNEQDAYFANLDRYKTKPLYKQIFRKEPDTLKHNRGSLRWYRGLSIAILQFPLVKAVITPIMIILTAYFCPTSMAARGIKIVDAIINAASTTTALLSLIRFYLRVRPILKPYHAVRKAFVLKKMVGLVLTQTLIMSIVQSANAIVPTAQMSYGDYTVGVIAFMSLCEMFLFSIGFVWCYNVKEYRDGYRNAGQETLLKGTMHKSSVGSALGATFNIFATDDLMSSIGRSLGHLVRLGGPKVYTPDGGFGKLNSVGSADHSYAPVSNNYGNAVPSESGYQMNAYGAPSSYAPARPAANFPGARLSPSPPAEAAMMLQPPRTHAGDYPAYGPGPQSDYDVYPPRGPPRYSSPGRSTSRSPPRQ